MSFSVVEDFSLFGVAPCAKTHQHNNYKVILFLSFMLLSF